MTPASEGQASALVHSGMLDFQGERHTLHVRLLPTVSGAVGFQEGLAHDLYVRNEKGYPASITGNGTRSVMFIDKGGPESFKKLRACRGWTSLREAFPPDSNFYFSPGLRTEDLAQGTVFLAKINRDDAPATLAAVLVGWLQDEYMNLVVAPMEPLLADE